MTMRRQAYNLLLHVFQNRNTFGVVEASDDSEGEVEVGLEAERVVRLRAVNLI